jgi:hypothetical protein
MNSSTHRPALENPARVALVAALAFLVLIVSCSPPIKQPVGAERQYLDAKDLFKKGNIDKALDYSDDLASATPPNAYTERARTLRLMIYGGRVRAYRELADAYAKGIDKTKNPKFKAEYQRVRNDALQYAAKAALGVAETAHQMLGGDGIGNEVVLDVPYPSVEGPENITQLGPLLEGGWVEPSDQEAAAVAAREKGIDDELAKAVGGDRAKARTELTAGPVKIPGVDFKMFLGQELFDSAMIFDRKHYSDLQKMKLVAGVADEVVKGVLETLKTNPDKDKEKAAKKIQSDLQAAIKKNSVLY